MAAESLAESRRHKVIIVLLAVGVTFLAVALSLNTWWVTYRHPRKTFGLFQGVTGENGVFTLSEGQEHSTILFIRVMITMCTCFTAIAMLIHLAFTFVFKSKAIFMNVSGTLSGLSGFWLFITSMVMIGLYHQISKAFYRARSSSFPRGTDPLWYRTLPLFFILMASVICIVASVFTFVKLDKPKTLARESFQMSLQNRKQDELRQMSVRSSDGKGAQQTPL